MAIVSNPLIGTSRGKVGGTVFTKMYGKNILKTKASEVRNPQTDAQKIQRNKFAAIISLLKYHKTNVRILGKAGSASRSPYSNVMSVNLGGAVTATATSATIDFTEVKFGIGSEYLGDTGLAFSSLSAGNVILSWSSTAASLGLSSAAIVYIDMLCTDLDDSKNVSVSALYSVGSWSELGNYFAEGDNIYAYVTVYDPVTDLFYQQEIRIGTVTA